MKTKTKIKTPFQQIDIRRIVRNPEQPRKYFDPQEMQELTETIKEHGVIEPIVVEACKDVFILHDGERRWLAAGRAGLKKVPAIIMAPLNGTGPRERLERALVANVQRSEMHPIEEGLAYQRLMTEFKYDLKEVVKRSGKSYTRVHYCLELLKLDADIQQLMLERKLPCERKAVAALLSVENSKERIAMAGRLAERNATATGIVMACHRYNMVKAGLKNKNRKGSPAIRLITEGRPEWDALFQLGKVPPWPLVNDSVMSTCDACPLRNMANDTTCSDCALVIFLQRTMEAAHAHK